MPDETRLEKSAPSVKVNAEQKRMPSLDGLRAIAILLVVFGHAFNEKEMPGSIRRVLGICFNSSLGVQIFFALSGFLITTLLLKEQDRTSNIDLKAFYRRRFFRILPASYLYLTTVAILSLVGIISVSGHFLWESFAFILNYQILWGEEGHGYWYVAHFWTLCLEQQFYLIWPAILAGLSHRSATRVLCALIILMPILRVVHYFATPGLRGQLGMMFHTGSDSIFIGSLAAMTIRLSPQLKERIRGICWQYILGVGIWLFVLSPIVTDHLRGSWNLSIGRTINGGAAALLLLWLVEYPTSLFGRILNTKPFVYVGTISYGLYLWQQVFLADSNIRSYRSIVAGVVAAFVVAAVSFHFFEKPLLKFAKSSPKGAKIDTSPI